MGDWYVDSINGNDGNGGTAWNDAYATIGAVSTPLASDTVHVNQGTYIETIAPSVDLRSDKTLIDFPNDVPNNVLLGGAGTGTGGANSFQVIGSQWNTDQYSGHYLFKTNGIDSGSEYLITGNTNDTLTVVGTPEDGEYTIGGYSKYIVLRLQTLGSAPHGLYGAYNFSFKWTEI